MNQCGTFGEPPIAVWTWVMLPMSPWRSERSPTVPGDSSSQQPLPHTAPSKERHNPTITRAAQYWAALVTLPYLTYRL